MAEVRHATQKWVSEHVQDALKDYTPGPGGGGTPAGSSSPILTSPDGTRYRQVVGDDGVIRAQVTLEPGPPPMPANLALES